MNNDVNSAYVAIQKFLERIELLEKCVDHIMDILTKYADMTDELTDRFKSIDHLIQSAQSAESLFAKKVHDLQSIDKKRDDVINVLCQKIEALTKRVIEDHPHPLIGRLEAFMDKL